MRLDTLNMSRICEPYKLIKIYGLTLFTVVLQTLPPFEANGIILDYEVILTRWQSHAQNYTVNDTVLNVNLTSDRYIATLTARNLVGRSDISVLSIPACGDTGLCL